MYTIIDRAQYSAPKAKVIKAIRIVYVCGQCQGQS